MNNIKMNDVLSQLRAVAAQNGLRESPEAAKSEGPSFSSGFKQAIDKVNETQQQATQMAERFELGDPEVQLSQVMIEMQKARVSFEAVTQVRNKLISAYQEIMNMQV